MKELSEELEVNFRAFADELKKRLNNSFESLAKNQSDHLESYKRLSSLEAWKGYILEVKISSSALEFFLEAQNDALLSHALARIGAWRSALQSLRSAIENTLFCLYYKDHPVEYQLWELGKNQIPISDYMKYISKHPAFRKVNANLTGLGLLEREYSTLSRAVHASSMSFRMIQVEEQFPAITLPELPRLNQWLARERNALQLINQILITMYSTDLKGAKLRDLRKSISLAIPQSLFEPIRKQFGIRLFDLKG
jgi:hypothetical protein